MKAIKGFAEVSKWILTVALPLLALLNVFGPGRETNNTFDFVLFCFSAALPDIIIITAIVWFVDYFIKHRGTILPSFVLPPQMLRQRLGLKRTLQYSASVIGLLILGFTLVNIESLLRARRRFYVYLFGSAYEQVTERQHLFDALTWNYSGAANSAKRLLTFPERQDARRLTSRARAYEGILRYGKQLTETGDYFYERTDTDHRLAVDHYCEVLYLSPTDTLVRERLRTLLKDISEKDDAIRALYVSARSANDASFVAEFQKLKGYLFENAVAIKIGELNGASPASKVAPQFRQYILSYPSEAALLASYHQSWRTDEAQQLVQRSQYYHKVASLKPKRWAALAKLLLNDGHSYYARAVMNSVTGLRSLDNNEHRLRFQAIADSDDDGFEEAMSIFDEHLEGREMDVPTRLTLAGLWESQQEGKKVLEVLKPLGESPVQHADEVYSLRVSAHSLLRETSIARNISRDWFKTSSSMEAFQTWGELELSLSAAGRFQPVIEWLSTLCTTQLSIDQYDGAELDSVAKLLEDAGQQIEEKLPSMTSAQKAELLPTLQPLIAWMLVEMPSRPMLIAIYIDFAKQLAPENPVFSLLAAQNELLFEDGATTRENERTHISALKADQLPREFGERIRDVQIRLARQNMEIAELGNRDVVLPVRTTKDPVNAIASIAPEQMSWRDMDRYPNPKEKVFEAGFELYSLPSIHSRKLKTVLGRTSAMVLGELKSTEGIFYITDWSYNRFQSGLDDGSYLKALGALSVDASEPPIGRAVALTNPVDASLPKAKPSGEAGYMKTADDRAWVWNNTPRPDDVASWEGSIDDQGFASGPGLLTWSKGQKFITSYRGVMQKGRLTGTSIATDAAGSHSEVWWKDGKKVGSPVAAQAGFPISRPDGPPGYMKTRDGRSWVWNNLPRPNDQAEWVGAVDENGFASGKGVLRWFKGNVFVTQYEGTVVAGRLDGSTVSTDASGKQTIRVWKNGVRQ